MGSIPFGYIIAKLCKGIDIRVHGSGNVGATNVFRVAGPTFGIISFILDFFKGFIAFYIGLKLFNINEVNLLLLSSFVIIGHDFSPFLKFKGGKGVATTIGVITTFNYKIALFITLVWIIVLILSGYVSLASIAGYISVPIFIIIFSPSIQNILFSIIASALGITRHSSNIKRLLNHTEHKMLNFNKKLWS